jgi:pimeloyl-ACP methyl ester carboxylesterase
MTKVTAEFEGMRRIHVGLEEYRLMATPTLLIAGGRTRRPTRAVVAILNDVLTSARLQVLPTAGHMSPFTHRDEILELIVEQVDARD